MKSKIIYLLRIVILVSSIQVCAFASLNQTDEINIGGKAICKVIGNSPVKRFIADGNRLLLLENEGVTKGSFQIQLLKSDIKGLIDINILALLGEVDNVDDFLNGQTLKFSSNDSDLVIKKTEISSSESIELTNELNDGQKGILQGKIKIKKNINNEASGKLLFVVEVASLDTNLNREIGLRCKFRNVPVEIKPLI